MPKANLVTRTATSSSVTDTNLNKGSALTHAEMDSNLINLRDASFGIRDDSSTVLQVTKDKTIHIAGGTNCTSALSGDTITINATGDVTGSSTTTFTNKTFDADGTGNNLTNIEVANLKSGVLDTDLSSVAGTDTTLASAKAIKAYVDANAGGGSSLGDLTAVGSTLSSPSNADITIQTSGTGNVVVENLSVAGDGAVVTGIKDEDNMSSDSAVKLATQQSIKAYADTKAVLTGSTNNTIATVTGAHALNGEANLTFDGSTLAVTGAATVSTTLGVTGASTLDGVTITDNTVSSNASNADLEISANGTGVVSLSPDGTFSSLATATFTDNFGAVDRAKGVHMFRAETIGSALTSSSDRRQGHLIAQQYTLGNYSSSDKDNRYRAQTVGVAVDLNGATVNSTNNFAGALGAQGQAAVENRDASNAGTIGNTIGVMAGSYFYSPQTVNVTNAHGMFSYVEQDDGGGAITLTNAFAYKAQINKLHGTMTNGYAYYIDANGATNKYGFYDTTNSESRMGAVRLDNQSGDPTNGADFCHIYAKDVSSSSKVFVREEDGTATRISPHNDKGEWEFYSYNKKTGKKVIINMERMIRKLEKYTGEKFIETE